jgi:uncharacterized surface protein with fasciclin (FAS1) repeats
MKKTVVLLVLIALTATVAFGSGSREASKSQEAEMMKPTIAEIAAGDERLTTLVTALSAAGLVDTLNGEGPFTVFAPTNDAFAALPEGALEGLLADNAALTQVLLYHVAPGRFMASEVVSLTEANTAAGKMVKISSSNMGVMINDARVVITDIEASNGVIHVIDSVMLPPQEMAMMSDLVDTAVSDGRFTTLVTAVKAAGLVETLKGAGPFTVFAPTDAAFAKLPAGTIESLLADTAALANILLYHVVPGRVMAADVVALSQAATANTQDVQIRVMDGKVMVNDAEVIITDIEASNGVIHVIDTVILPPA